MGRLSIDLLVQGVSVLRWNIPAMLEALGGVVALAADALNNWPECD